MDTSKHETLVDALVVQLSREIFRGTYAPEDKLPPLRKMARQHEVTVPTTQRAVARLEEMGLVSVRQGSGVRVQDPRTHVGPSALPYWIDAVLDRPAEARALLVDFLELRRMLAVDSLVRLRRANKSARERVREAVGDFAEVVERKDIDLVDIVRADLQVARRILACRPQIAFATVFNVLERLLLSVELLQEAMYASPAQNLAGYQAVLAILDADQSDDDFAQLVREQLALADQRSVERFINALNPPQEES